MESPSHIMNLGGAFCRRVQFAGLFQFCLRHFVCGEEENELAYGWVITFADCDVFYTNVGEELGWNHAHERSIERRVALCQDMMDNEWGALVKSSSGPNDNKL